MFDQIYYGRKTILFSNGRSTFGQVSITERALPDEDEEALLERLLAKYANKTGTIQIVFKRSRPEYAILTFD